MAARVRALSLDTLRQLTLFGWGAIALSLCLALVCIVGWREIRDQRRQVLLSATQAAARACANALESSTWRQVVTLRQLATSWAHYRPEDEREWKLAAGSLMTQLPAVRRIEWLGAAGWSMGDGSPARLDPSFDASESAALARVTASREETLVGPVRLGDGSAGFQLLLPVVKAGDTGPRQPVHVLRATIAIEPMLHTTLMGRAPGHHVSLTWDGLVLGSVGPEPAAGHAWWAAEYEAVHPLGVRWQVALRPGAALVESELTPLPDLLLASGLVAALTIGGLVGATRLATRRAHALQVANASLSEVVRRTSPEQAVDEAARSTLECQVIDRAAELREAVAELETFNLSVSHDLRSPIGAIVNFTSVLRQAYGARLDDAGLGYLRRIESAATRAIARMDALLAFSSIRRRPIDPKEVDLRALAQRIFHEVNTGPRAREVELAIDELPLVVGDPPLLEILMRNLLANALKFSRGAEHPRVQVGATSHPSSKAPVFFVRDNGVGFDPRFSSRLFGLFERLHSASDFEGTGVGLAVVARIVRRHGGRVSAEGAIGEGATIYFSLDGAHEDSRKGR
ncbi:MAG TPA: ATP-binding protein [Myxococcota bacterium]|nr:ATP-binding protein [Myxococcota bacterium]